VLDAVQDLPGLDLERFERDLTGQAAPDAYQKDWQETRQPNDYVCNLEGNWPGIGNLKPTDGLDRYAFPTLLCRGSGGEYTVPGWCPFEAYLHAMEEAVPGSTADPRPDPTPEAAFKRWPLLAAVEFDTLCGSGAEPPSGVKTYDWGHGVIYFRPEVYPALRHAGVA
jgi:hypothetical protein